jgi:peptidoglycan/LPS O-acetylase OafA/YrhL
MHQVSPAEFNYTRGRLESLDLLRGIAATAVLVYHSTGFLGFQMLPQSYLAVDLFFVLSGFVIAHSYDRRIASGMSNGEFLVQRVIRLYPCYILAFVVCFALGAVRLAHEAGYVDVRGLAVASALNLVMLPAFNRLYNEPSLFPFNGASWSIFFELVVNVFYVVLFRFLGRRSIAVIMVLSAVVLSLGVVRFGSVDIGMRPADFLFGVPRVCFSFFFGVAIRRYLPSHVSSRHQAVRILAVSALLVLIFASADILPPHSTVFSDLACVFVLMPLIVALTSRIQALGAVRAISEWAGDASYPIYLLQGAFFLLFAALPLVLLHRRAAQLQPWIGIALIVTTIAVAVIVDRYFELPIRNALKRRWQSWWFGAPSMG